MPNENQMLMLVSFFVGAVSTYLVIHKDDIVALGNLLFVFIIITMVVGLVGIAAALGFVGVAFVFVCYIIYLIGLKIRAKYQRRKRG